MNCVTVRDMNRVLISGYHVKLQYGSPPQKWALSHWQTRQNFLMPGYGTASSGALSAVGSKEFRLLHISLNKCFHFPSGTTEEAKF